MTNTKTPATFCIWLQGFLDRAGDSLDTNQLATLKAKLDMVFTHPESGPDHAILTERLETDPATEGGWHLTDEFWKMLEEIDLEQSLMANDD
jgi:hypothetical protein